MDAPAHCRYSLDLTAIDDQVEGSLAAASGFRREFQSRLELLAAIEAALAAQTRGVRPADMNDLGGTP